MKQRYFFIFVSFLLQIYQPVLAQLPVISSFIPASGPPGTIVTISGNNFNATAENNAVYFGEIKATVNAATNTQLTVTVPGGFSQKPLSVTANGLTGFSSVPFLLTYAGTDTLTPRSFEDFKNLGSTGLTNNFVIGDLDGDGKPDIAESVVVYGETFPVNQNRLLLKRNTSISGAISFDTAVEIIAGSNPVLKDMDGDGKLDIIINEGTGMYNTLNLDIFRNLSSPGSISFAPPQGIIYNQQDSSSISMGDMNEDGKIDILVCRNNLISFYKNTSIPGSLSFDTPVDFVTNSDRNAVLRCDIDGDGKPELLSTNYGDSVTRIYRNTSAMNVISFDTAFQIQTGVNIYSNSNSNINPVLVDLDGDGMVESAGINTQTNKIYIQKNTSTNGKLSFAPGIEYPVTAPTLLLAGDLDGDGKPDLCIERNTFSEGSYLTFYKNTSANNSISFGNAVPIITQGYFPGFTPVASINDLDGDGLSDLIFLNENLDMSSFGVNRNFVNHTPLITSFTPTNGTGNTSITITGYNFSQVNSVKIGNTDVISFTIVSSDTLTAVVADGSAGYVRVINSYGEDSSAIFNIPKILSFSPSFSSFDSTIIIRGINFVGTTNVSFGGKTANTFSVESDSVIKATVGYGSSGDVSVTNSYGKGVAANFYYLPVTIDTFCAPSGNKVISANYTNAGYSYKWEIDSGNGFFEINDDTIFSGSATADLTIHNLPSSFAHSSVRCGKTVIQNGNHFYTDLQTIMFIDSWTGAVSKAWENPANWSCGAVPDSNTDVVISHGIIEINSDVVVRRLDIDPTANITVTTGHQLKVLH